MVVTLRRRRSARRPRPARRQGRTGDGYRRPIDVISLATAERTDLADLLDTLDDDQWQTPSLCAGWTVRDVVTHMLSFEDLGPVGIAGALARGWFLPSRINAQRLATFDGVGPDELRARLRAHARPRGLTTGFGGRVALTDALVHHQDIRRPLGLDREVPPERLRAVLPFALRAPVLPAIRLSRGLRLVATDLDWARGDGPELVGPGEALLVAVMGRADALDDLSGDGVAILARRIAPG